MDIVEAAGVVIGSTVLVTGLALSALAATAESFPGVFAGFTLFVVGYKLSQIAVRDTRDTALAELVDDILSSAGLIDLLMTVVGTGAITYGFILLFAALNRTDILLAGAGSALMFGGYATAHYGVNRTVV
ncbi:MAG: hypothetical protein SVW77_03730 [Candidatus Nanohaloarchaea archaeon]|nr:hypothetical protein [Candidatus Nanohaloarchaea archaeon]